MLPGSGGLYGINSGIGGAGGGAVRIHVAERFELNGKVTADAGGSYILGGATQSTGGSGGSILIMTRQFAGGPDALLSANGSPSRATFDRGGGGGRIAVWTGTSASSHDQLILNGDANAPAAAPPPGFFGNASAAGGTPSADEGSIVWIQLIRGTIVFFR